MLNAYLRMTFTKKSLLFEEGVGDSWCWNLIEPNQKELFVSRMTRQWHADRRDNTGCCTERYGVYEKCIICWKRSNHRNQLHHPVDEDEWWLVKVSKGDRDANRDGHYQRRYRHWCDGEKKEKQYSQILTVLIAEWTLNGCSTATLQFSIPFWTD